MFVSCLTVCIFKSVWRDTFVMHHGATRHSSLHVKVKTIGISQGYCGSLTHLNYSIKSVLKTIKRKLANSWNFVSSIHSKTRMDTKKTLIKKELREFVTGRHWTGIQSRTCHSYTYNILESIFQLVRSYVDR